MTCTAATTELPRFSLTPHTHILTGKQAMEPTQLLAALASCCQPRSSREALVLACHAACLLQPDLVPLSSSSSSSTSLLNAFHESSEGVYPTQGFAVQVPRAGHQGQGQGKAEVEGEEDHLYIKPLGHGRCSSGNDEADEQNEAILVLFGRRPGLSEAAVHRLELGVRDYILPSTRGSGKKEEDGKKGTMAEEEKTVAIPGGSRQGRSSTIYACRFDALTARLATHFLCKVRPELYAAQQLPSFSDVMRTEGSPTPSSSSSASSFPSSFSSPSSSSSSSSPSSSSPSLLLNELLPFLSCPSMLRLAATARQYQRSLAQEERAWKTLLQRDYPAAAASLASSSTSSSSTTSSSSSSSSSSTPSPPVHRAPESARTVYRRLFLSRPHPLPSRRTYHPDDWGFPFCHLPPSTHHPHYPSLPHPLYYLPGGLGGGRAGGTRGGGEARPRYMPAFGAPPLWF